MGVVVPDPPEPEREIPIDAHCVVCGFKLGCRLVLGGGQIRRESKEKGCGVKALRGEMADKDTRVIFDRMISR